MIDVPRDSTERGSFRILHLIHSIDPREGGMSEGLRQICLAHGRLGHAYEVVTLDTPDSTWLSDFPGTVHPFGPTRMRFGYTGRLVPWLKEHATRFDAVVVHGLWQFHGLAARRALAGGKVPYFIFPHGMLDPWFKRAQPVKHLKKLLYWKLFERETLEQAGGILFTTDDEARLAPHAFPMTGWRAITVGFGIDPPAPPASEKASRFVARWPECSGKRIVLFLSRIHPKKGCDLLIGAFATAALRDLSLHLVIAGPDAENLRPQLEAQARKLCVASRISWTGMLEGEDKWAALQAAEVFALFSHQENFGLAVVEALAMGLPVLITHPINIAADIAKRGAGYVDDDTPAGAVRLLERWQATPAEERATMRLRAVACFEALFHIDAATRRMVDEVKARPSMHAAA